MKYFNLTYSIVTVICIFVMAGCATRSQHPRETIVFNYTPASQAAPGSADVTFAVVGARLGVPAPQGMVQLPSQAPVPLFVDFASTMTKDFMEVLGARGFGVRGPFETYDEMIHPDKEGSHLILTAEVVFKADTSRTQLKEAFFPRRGVKIVGSVTGECDVNLVASESLTNVCGRKV